MKSLFDKNTNDEIIDRIEKLTPTLKPLWGKLEVEQMLAHLNLSLQVNFGQIELKSGFLSLFFRGIARSILLGHKPFPKHLPAPKKILSSGKSDFMTEKQNLMSLLKIYIENGPTGLSKNPHNILGKITPEESSFISYKHLDHHLRQFGV